MTRGVLSRPWDCVYSLYPSTNGVWQRVKIKNICILGGTGFVGQHLVAKLASDGYSCRIISRHPQRHRALQVLPGVTLVKAGGLDSKTLEPIFADCDAVINLIGILNEAGKDDRFRQASTI